MFGRNDGDNQQDPAGSAGPPLVDPVASADPTVPAMPLPDQMISPQSNPIADPTAMPTAPAMDTQATVADPATSAPDPLSAVPAEPTMDDSVNGVAVDAPTVEPDIPQITSDYDSKPGTAVLDSPVEDELIDIKKKALESLAPLVDELDQTPDEKFKTTMMLIQASDNAELVKDAFAAANAIADEKGRAQALLDVVNEINYFTQPHDTPLAPSQ